MNRSGRTWWAIGGAVAAFGLVVALIALAAGVGAGNYRVQFDQDAFHLPTVRQFQRQWPHVDLHDYAVATSPGYHLLMAAIAVYVRDSLVLMRCVGAVFGFGLVGLAAWGTSRRSAALALPLAMSVYVLTSTVWLLPENAAWMLVAAGLLLALHACGARLFWLSAIVLTLLVFVRHSHIWMVGVFVVAALTEETPEGRLRLRLSPPRLLATFAAALPPVAVLLWLISIWHGLSPLSFQPGVKTDLFQALPVGGFAPGAPAMMLAVLGAFGVLLLPWLWPAGRARGIALLGGVIGFLLGVLPASSYNFPLRRSGFWAIIQKLHQLVFFDRSLIFIAGATLGGVVAAVALARLKPRDRLIFAAALAGLTAVQMTQVYLWQRYYEPFVLLWLGLAAAATPAIVPPPRHRSRVIGLTLLIVLQLLAVAYTLQNSN
ncbi:MAG: hypothetical protein JWM57_1822 [Phycisphaerales bacterium]|nr:hypothetical protein [Phycisphaerales bacterium]